MKKTNNKLEEYINSLSDEEKVGVLLERFGHRISQQDKVALTTALAEVLEAKALVREDLKAPPYHVDLGHAYLSKKIRLCQLHIDIINKMGN